MAKKSVAAKADAGGVELMAVEEPGAWPCNILQSFDVVNSDTPLYAAGVACATWCPVCSFGIYGSDDDAWADARDAHQARFHPQCAI